MVARACAELRRRARPRPHEQREEHAIAGATPLRGFARSQLLAVCRAAAERAAEGGGGFLPLGRELLDRAGLASLLLAIAGLTLCTPTRSGTGSSPGAIAPCSHGASAERAAVDDALFVVAQAWFVVAEEDFADEVAAAADAGLAEDVLEVLLDGMG